MPTRLSVLLVMSMYLSSSPLSLATEEFAEVNTITSEVTVLAKRIANTETAGSVQTLASALRFDPGIDLQSRSLAESQSDITVQGGVFENTGTRVGAVTIFDPQTGHYVADLPIAPEALSRPRLLVGVGNAIGGFNAVVATIQYTPSLIESGGHVGIAAGSDDMWSQRLHVAGAAQDMSEFGSLAGSLFYASSKGDGTRPNGEHDFEQILIRGQLRDDHRQTDVMFAYQDKFFAWPGAYTGFATLAETDYTKTHLLLLNHRQRLNAQTDWSVGAFYRTLDDDYDFDRTTEESGVPGAFEHETTSYGIGLEARHESGGVNWQLGLQLSGDELNHSTDLTEGSFTTRNYASLRMAPEKTVPIGTNSTLAMQLGVSLDASNRDEDVVLPLMALRTETNTASGVMRWSFEYAASSQLPGYTALKSRPSGLFGGNADLGRERADAVHLSFAWEASRWGAKARLFHRRDDDLVDWTYLSGAPFARQANSVDLDVTGFQGLWYQYGARHRVTAGYSYLHKASDYGAAAVDASYYALNFARHRLTLALTYELLSDLELRWDNEYREQLDNPLRNSAEDAYTASIGLVWRPRINDALEATLIVDNVTDNDFQDFPGTPAVGRHAKIGVRYDW